MSFRPLSTWKFHWLPRLRMTQRFYVIWLWVWKPALALVQLLYFTGLLHPQNLASDCWQSEQELICLRWKLYILVDKMHQAALSGSSGVNTNTTQWIRDHLSHIPNSDPAKDYVCANHIYYKPTCEELLHSWNSQVWPCITIYFGRLTISPVL